MVYSTYSGK